VKSNSKDTRGLTVRERFANLEREARERDKATVLAQQEALKLRLFPCWPDDRRGAPSEVVRSAIFGAVKKGRKARVVDMPVAANEGTMMTLTGWTLDQSDFDVWLEIHHLAQNSPPGSTITFTRHAMLERLELSSKDGHAYSRLERRLKHLMETTLSYDIGGGEKKGGSGNLIASYRIDATTDRVVVRTNPEMRPLWESVAWINIAERRMLKSLIAKALHAMLGALPEWPAMRLDNLMIRLGLSYRRIANFRTDLRKTLDDFQERGWVRSYSLGRGEAGLVVIDKVPTPSQARAIEKKALKS